jgi:hypothetical protein
VFLNSANKIIDNIKNKILNLVIDLYAERDRAQKTNKEDVEVILIR